MGQHKQHNEPPIGEAPGFEPQQLYEAIAAQPEHKVETVPITQAGVFDITEAMGQRTTRVLGSEGGAKDVVQQELHAVVKAGDELFGVVHVDVGGEGVSELLLTRFNQNGERAGIIGVIPAWFPTVGAAGLKVGREHQQDLHNTVSRDHFSIGTLGNRLLIGEYGSTNGTTIIRMRTQAEREAQIVSPKPTRRPGIVGHVGRRIAERRQPKSTPENPLLNHRLWSATAAEAREDTIRHTAIV
jgi:hypothetical protein